MKVLLLATSLALEHGGVATSVRAKALALARNGVDVGVWTRDSIHPNEFPSPTEPVLRRFTGPLDKALLDFGRPDIVHDHELWLPYHRSIARIARRERIPRIVSIGGGLQPWAFHHKRGRKTVAWFLYQRRSLDTAQLIHVTSDIEAGALRQLGLSPQIATIPYGVDVPEIPVRPTRPDAREPKIALFVGRIHPVKSLTTLVTAWARVRPPDWRLRIVGPDEDGHQATVERSVREGKIEDVVTFAGPLSREQTSAAYWDADLFVLPSHSENFGNVVVEALSHSIPVLTTTGTPWSTLDANDCGWWVPPDIAGLEAGLRAATALGRSELAMKGAKGREWMRREFSWDSIADRLKDSYAAVIARAT